MDIVLALYFVNDLINSVYMWSVYLLFYYSVE